MNNEPVAWMFEYGTDRGDAVNGISWYSNVHFKKPDLGGLIRNIEPLYTHPVKTPRMILDGNRVYPCLKELTDEEIDECLYSTDWSYDPHSFARAILRKAQEK